MIDEIVSQSKVKAEKSFSQRAFFGYFVRTAATIMIGSARSSIVDASTVWSLNLKILMK